MVDPAARYAIARGDRARLPDRDPAAARAPARDPDPPRRARLERRRDRRAARVDGRRGQLGAAAGAGDDRRRAAGRVAGRGRALAARAAAPSTSTPGSAPTSTAWSSCCARTRCCGCRPSRSIVGAEAIGEFWAEGPCGGGVGRMVMAAAWANGRPAVVMHRLLADGTAEPHGILVFELDGDADRRLRRLHRRRPGRAVRARLGRRPHRTAPRAITGSSASTIPSRAA